MSTLLINLEEYIAFIGKDFDYFYNDIYINDIMFIKYRIEKNINISKIVKKYFSNTINNNHYIVAILNFFVRQFGKWNVILIIDNVDGTKIALQKEIVTTASALCVQNIKIIIPIRKATANNIKYKNPEFFGTFVQNEIFPPLTSQILKKRADKALEEPELRNATLSEGHLVFKVKDCVEFSETISKAFSHPAVDRLLNGLSNDSVQQALKLAVKVYASNYIDAKKIIRRLSPPETIIPSPWRGYFPYYIVIKALLHPDRPVYLSEDAQVANIFGTHQYQYHFGPFMRVYILKYIVKNNTSKIKLDDILNELSTALIIKESIIREEFDWLVRKDWIEEQNEGVYAVTTLGRYIIEELLYDMEYLTHISVDIEMPKEIVYNIKVPADSPMDRSNNLILLINFLVNKEKESITHCSAENDISYYIKLFGNDGITEKIVRNIKKNLKDIKSGKVNNDIIEAIDVTIEKLNELNITLGKINKILKN